MSPRRFCKWMPGYLPGEHHLHFRNECHSVPRLSACPQHLPTPREEEVTLHGFQPLRSLAAAADHPPIATSLEVVGVGGGGGPKGSELWLGNREWYSFISITEKSLCVKKWSDYIISLNKKDAQTIVTCDDPSGATSTDERRSTERPMWAWHTAGPRPLLLPRLELQQRALHTVSESNNPRDVLPLLSLLKMLTTIKHNGSFKPQNTLYTPLVFTVNNPRTCILGTRTPISSIP